jgi:hypothetical protein
LFNDNFGTSAKVARHRGPVLKWRGGLYESSLGTSWIASHLILLGSLMNSPGEIDSRLLCGHGQIMANKVCKLNAFSTEGDFWMQKNQYLQEKIRIIHLPYLMQMEPGLLMLDFCIAYLHN